MVKISTKLYIELVKAHEERDTLQEQMTDIMVLYNGLLMKNAQLQIENDELLNQLSTCIHGSDPEDIV